MMATSSGGRAGIATANNPSSSSFGVLSFAQGHHQLQPALTNAKSQPNTSKFRSSDGQSNSATAAIMAQASRPSSGQNVDRATMNAPAQHSQDQTDDTSSAPPQEDMELVGLISGGNKESRIDARVKNSGIPSKLKGRTDVNNYFGVMHMAGEKKMGSSDERNEAARKTSERTQQRAKDAQTDKYAPARKMMDDISKSLMNDVSSRSSPMALDQKQRARPLSPDETKVEQARLLTLLRSIHPVTVVDQICKAVAYFGGIPGAPPPEDGIFPESANTRETGALFIGWLAEIFPDLSTPEVPRTSEPHRKNKGARVSNAAAPVETPNPRNGYGFGQAVSAPAWGLPQSLALVNTPVVASPEQSKPYEMPRPSTPPKLVQEDQIGNASTGKRGRGRPKGSTNKNRVARPEVAPKGGAGSSGMTDLNGGLLEPAHLSPTLQKEPDKIPELPESHVAYTPMGQHDASRNGLSQGYPDNPWYTNNQKPPTEAPSNSAGLTDDLSPEERAVIEAFSQNPDAPAPAPTATRPPILPPGKGPQATGAKRKRAPPKPKPAVVPSPNPPAAIIPPTQNIALMNDPHSLQPSNTHSSAIDNMASMSNDPIQWPSVPKAPNSLNEAMSNIGNDPMQRCWTTSKSSHSTINSLGGMTNDSLQWSSVPKSSNPTTSNENLQWIPSPQTSSSTISAPAPPVKRQRVRKPKAPAANGSPGTFGSPAVNSPLIVSATPPLAPSSIPDSTATSAQQTILQPSQSTSVSRPPAEGLEAHYERFANTPQQNGRKTPSINPQQQLRQQQKPQSVTPQSQQSPSIQKQHHLQMQQTKSQQGMQRDEQQQKASQVPARSSSSSSGFNSQRNSQVNTYNQQYPSHQPSQLYNSHQASGQMTGGNTYRNSSSLSQASPQFPQTDTYRTASPHSIPQPSPSFTQPDNTYRSTSSHSLTQPSPTYTQAENPYRTPSTQAATSYSRTQTQPQPSHQTHYGHFDSPYGDLPTLDSLGHTGSSSAGGALAAYQQNIMGTSTASRSQSNSNSLYGTSSGMGAFDSGTNDLLRGANRTATTGNSYGTSSGLGAFDVSSASEQERMMRGIGRR